MEHKVLWRRDKNKATGENEEAFTRCRDDYCPDR